MIRASSSAPLEVIMEEITDPQELTRTKAQRERFWRNSAWLQAHVPEVYSHNRGKTICVAGQELFVGETPKEVISLARKAHPEDDGLLIRYIPKKRLLRIYAY
jgi:hypothetical protein